VFAIVNHFKPIQAFAGKAGAYQSGALLMIQLYWVATRCAPIIRRGWKWLTLENSLAYFDTAKITAVKFLKYRHQEGVILFVSVW